MQVGLLRKLAYLLVLVQSVTVQRTDSVPSDRVLLNAQCSSLVRSPTFFFSPIPSHT